MKKKIDWKKILEWIKAFADTITALTPIIRMLLVASGAFAVAMLVGDFKNKTALDSYAAASEKHQQETKAALQQVEAYKAQVVQLQTETAAIEMDNSRLERAIIETRSSIQTNKKQAVVLTKSLDTSKTQKDSIETLIKIIPVKDSIIEKQDSVILKQDTTINNLNLLVENKDKQIQTLQITVNTLDSVVRTIPVYDKCEQKFFFCKINKPSRKTSVVAGFTLGVLTAGVLLR